MFTKSLLTKIENHGKMPIEKLDERRGCVMRKILKRCGRVPCASLLWKDRIKASTTGA